MLFVEPDAERVAAHAARLVAEALNAAVAARGRATVALAGGGTPKALYRLLVADTAVGGYRQALPWPQLHFFFGDERPVAPEHADSNYRMARETLFASGLVADGQVHRVAGELGNAQEAAAQYERELVRYFGVAPSAWPRFDVVLLGLGSDGHTASLFPGTLDQIPAARWVAAPHVDRLGAARITLTPGVFNHAALVIFLVTGREKSGALRQLLTGDCDPEQLPSSAIAPVAGRLVVVADAAAASELS